MEELKNNTYHHIFKLSLLHKTKHLLSYFVMALLFLYFTYIMFEKLNISYIFLFLFYSIVPIIAIFKAKSLKIKRKKLIQISDKGIWVFEKGFFYWNEIKSMRIDKKDILLSLFNDGEFDDFEILFKDINKSKISTNIHGIENRKTLVALADNYIEINK